MKGQRGKRVALAALCLVLAVLFAALGIWQIERLAWKRDLIARVEARLAAPPAPLPKREHWAGLTRQGIEYRRIHMNGTFRHEAEVLVDALTERGAGYWVLTPLETAQGPVFVNRGFVPPERRAQNRRLAGLVEGDVRVTGLMRWTEPGGRFLRPNDPAKMRWFSRDIAAIAPVTGIQNPAPFFVDADAAPNPGGWPIGGMTVVRFRNAHLVYAMTWFALAALALGGLVLAVRQRPEAA
ncbi:SURF1 family protein [Qipengyuania sediminis]|uniref:SURF1 family protein n=1 Tax=Qipengyuania sediminis TaxID=1532023 RepID=UPI00105A5F9D|nr:SURF1 family protein [Qipengyuania sediminis]